MAAVPKTTSFFPPNPEDGELWLPSYLCHEIALPKKTTAPAAATPQPSPRHHASNKKQVRDTLHGVKPNVKTTVRNAQTCLASPYYNYPFPDSPLQFLPPTPLFYPPNPITSPNQFLNYNRKKPSGKSEGTGVFLPGSVKTSSKKEGTGVYLNNQVKVNPKKGGENDKCGLEKKTSLREEVRAKTQAPFDHFRLPSDWSY